MDEIKCESISLKWGTLKSWDLHTPESLAALRAYMDLGRISCAKVRGAIQAQMEREAVCRLIDACNAETICLEWTGELVSKDEAKEYVMTYRD